jgi:hypothetical protein
LEHAIHQKKKVLQKKKSDSNQQQIDEILPKICETISDI